MFGLNIWVQTFDRHFNKHQRISKQEVSFSDWRRFNKSFLQEQSEVWFTTAWCVHHTKSWNQTDIWPLGNLASFSYETIHLEESQLFCCLCVFRGYLLIRWACGPAACYSSSDGHQWPGMSLSNRLHIYQNSIRPAVTFWAIRWFYCRLW